MTHLDTAQTARYTTLAVAVAHLSMEYDGAVALDDVSFEIQRGDRVAVVGPNGAGKSTLFKALVGLLPVTKGQVVVAGQAAAHSTAVAYVPQRTSIDWRFPVSVADVVMMGRVGKLGMLRWPGKRDWAIVRRCLETVGMRDFARRQIGELSGGQQQRVFIARALAQEATLLLLDEPVSGLDVTAQHELQAIIAQLGNDGVTVMVATHDLNQAGDTAHYEQVLLLNRQLVASGRGNEVFTPERLAIAYKGQLRWIDTGNGAAFLIDSCCGEGEDALAQAVAEPRL